nr:RnfABCDGE type electron transport complex subunit G [Clostridium tetanomorphum]
MFSITAICALILAITNNNTKDVIVAREKMESLQLSVILPKYKATDVKEMDIVFNEEDIITGAYEAYEDGDVCGHAIMVTPKGMGGLIKMTVGICKDGTIGGLKVVSHSETPGIGDIVEKESFMGRFKNKSIKENIESVKSSPTKDNQVEVVTGATITSAAVSSGVNKAIEFYREKILGEEVKAENKEIEAKDIISQGNSMEPLDIKGNEKIKEVKGIYKDKTLIGYAITTSVKGMVDEIKTMVGISTKGKITNIKVLEQKETEGLGDIILKDEFTNKYKDKSVDKTLESVKEKPKLENEIEAVTGATISSNAVTNGVNEAIKFYNEKLKK